MKVDMNWVACLVAAREGKVQELSIAQVKEVLNCLRAICRDVDQVPDNEKVRVVVKEYLGMP